MFDQVRVHLQKVELIRDQSSLREASLCTEAMRGKGNIQTCPDMDGSSAAYHLWVPEPGIKLSELFFICIMETKQPLSQSDC